MPITYRAIKKLRRDLVRSRQNEGVEKKVKTIVKETRTSPTPKALARAYEALDKAAKHRIIHRNKAARLKSRLAKLLKKNNPTNQ